MTHNYQESGPASAPSLSLLRDQAAFVPIEVVERTEHAEPLPSLGDIVSAMPIEYEPDSELVPTVRLPLGRQAGGNRRRRTLVRASVAALVLLGGAGAAMAAWMTPPRLGDAPEVPTVATSSKLGVDLEALSLAVGARALARHSPAFVAPATPEPSASATGRAVLAAQAPEPAPVIEFDRVGASAALDRAATEAGSCRSEGDPSGVARAVVTFAPSGRVTSATVNGPPFAGTTTGGCIARHLRSATVLPFTGDHVTVAKTVVIY